MIRLVDRVTGAVVWVPNAWIAWTLGNLHFKRIVVGDRRRIIQWRARGENRWHALDLEPAIERRRQGGQQLHGWSPIRRAS